MTAEPDASELPRDWADALTAQGCRVGSLNRLVDDLYEGGAPVLPDRMKVFRAFHLTRLHDVRVVILGQDPYPKRKQRAQGLAFSVPGGVDIPRSLNSIFRNLESDDAITFDRTNSGDLTRWAKEGVLLLNTSLTVAENDAGSHKRHWRSFTDLVLKAIVDEQEHVVFLLWGKQAIERALTAGVTEPPHKLVRSAHPRGGRSRQDRFKDVRHFSSANQFLAHHRIPEVRWSLADED